MTITVKNLGKIVDEHTTDPFESGGEMERFIAEQFVFWLRNNFGFNAKTEVKK